MDAGEPIWYKIRPASIVSGGLGFVLIRTRLVPSHPVGIRITDNRGSTYVPLLLNQKNSKVQDSVCKFRCKLQADSCLRQETDARGANLSTSVYLDEIDITAQCRFASQDFWHDLGILTVALDVPLKEGSHHLLRLTTNQGVEIADMVRTKKDFFPVGVYGWSSKGATAVERMYDFYRSLKAHHFNTDLIFIWPKDSAIRNSAEGHELASRNDIMLLGADDKHWYVRDEIDIWEGVHLEILPRVKTPGVHGSD